MNDEDEAKRLADALRAYHLMDADVDFEAAAALLERWPDAGEPVAWLYTRKSDGHMAAVTKRMDAALKGADEWTETPLYTAPPDQSERIAALEAALEQARVALESFAGYVQPLTNMFGGPEVPAEGSTSALVNAALRKIEEVQR